MVGNPGCQKTVTCATSGEERSKRKRKTRGSVRIGMLGHS
jgi:hypothetical protein